LPIIPGERDDSMKKFLLLFVFSFEIFSVCCLDAQKVISNSGVTGVCYAGKKVNRIFIPPPGKVRTGKSFGGGGKITVIYSGFPAAAQNAVDYATGILEGMLPSDLKMTVRASWKNITTAGVLGNSSITGFAAGWSIDGFKPLVYYPITVAEKISGKSLNEDSEADVILDINSSVNWYTGTDGNTPVNRYDLVTVVIHELCHGLGFFDSMNVSNSLGYYGINNLPVIYDTFVEDINGRKLTDTTFFPQNSTSLYNALVSGELFFDGPLSIKYLGGNRPRLYAPATWDKGSSVSHLDELRTDQANALMTPFIDLGEAIHNPGNLTLSILGDLGWINTRIIPAGLKDTEENLSVINITTSIKSDTTYNKNYVGLVYSWDGFKTSDTLIMSPASGVNNFTASVPVPAYNSKLNYYFFATDTFLRTFRSPSLAEKGPDSVFVGIDTVRPVISHTPVDYYFEKVDTIPFSATVTDNLGVDTVYIEYILTNDPVKTFGLHPDGLDKFSSNVNVRPWLLKGGDSISYRIIAVDRAQSHNKKVLPASGFYVIKVEALSSVVKYYSTSFTNAGNDFFSKGFSIEQPSGFGSLSLNSEHPYKSPDEDGKSLNFSSVLRHPVIFDASGLVISYRELVLVEPGEEGSLYGFSDFYDYVVVEASSDYGKSWFPLADGYDSRIHSAWETAYNSLTDGQNSTYAGKESMMLAHNIYPKIADKVSAGDSLLIRFRLFSDPYSHGWGWVIDDLSIGPLVDQVEESIQGQTLIYPNPGNGILNIRLKDVSAFDKTKVSVFNSSGQVIISSFPCTGSETILDISGYPSGLYYLIIRDPEGVKAIKYTLMK
jgi:hypothetical protein